VVLECINVIVVVRTVKDHNDSILLGKTYLNGGYQDEQIQRDGEGVDEEEKKELLILESDSVVCPGTVVVHPDNASIGYLICSMESNNYEYYRQMLVMAYASP